MNREHKKRQKIDNESKEKNKKFMQISSSNSNTLSRKTINNAHSK